MLTQSCSNNQLTNTMTIRECGHLFCSHCISDILGKNGQCPKCGTFSYVKNLIKNTGQDSIVETINELWKEASIQLWNSPPAQPITGVEDMQQTQKELALSFENKENPEVLSKPVSFAENIKKRPSVLAEREVLENTGNIPASKKRKISQKPVLKGRATERLPRRSAATAVDNYYDVNRYPGYATTPVLSTNSNPNKKLERTFSKLSTTTSVHDGEWICKRCTFINKSKRKACQMCFGRKPLEDPQQPLMEANQNPIVEDLVKKRKSEKIIIVISGLSSHYAKDRVNVLMRDFNELFANQCQVLEAFPAKVDQKKKALTHLVTETDRNGCCIRTFKYLYALQHGCAIVSYKWLEECIKKNSLVPEDGYIVKGDSIMGPVNGPSCSFRRYLEKTRNSNVFHGCMFKIDESVHESDFKEADVIQLIKAGGGFLWQKEEDEFSSGITKWILLRKECEQDVENEGIWSPKKLRDFFNCISKQVCDL